MFTYTWFSTERNKQIKKVFCAIWNIWHLIHVQHMLAVLLANVEFTILCNTISLDHLPTVVFVVVISSFWTSVDKPTCLTIKVLLVLVSDCICQTQVKQIKYWGGNAVYTSPEELTNDDVSMNREEELICYSWSYMSDSSSNRRQSFSWQEVSWAKIIILTIRIVLIEFTLDWIVYFKLCLLHYFASWGLWIHWELRQPTIACQLFNHHSNMKTKMAACVFQTSLTLWS